MKTIPNLVVPIRISALCTGQEPSAVLYGATASFVDFPVQSDTQPQVSPYLSSSILPFNSSSATPGVHLHWLLPEALKRGRHAQSTGQVTFPQVPNRWLVTRIPTLEADADMPIKRWVIESNQENTEDFGQGSPTKPVSGATAAAAGQYFLRMGRFFEYEMWEESGCANPLTAVGYGEPSFADYYPNCRNVFGFFDDFNVTLGPSCSSDPDVGPLDSAHTFTYMVVGWYAQPENDPIFEENIEGVENELGWTFSGGAPDGMLCSAVIHNVQWLPNKCYIVDTQSDLDVAIGNSGAEALSALVANQKDIDADTDAEYLLNAVQKGLFRQLRNDRHRLGKLDLTLHQAEFSSEHGGTVWAVKPRVSSGPSGQMGVEATGLVSPTLSREIVEALQHLNDAQSSYDQASFEVESMRRQIFNDWYRVQLLNDPEGLAQLPQIDVGNVQTLIYNTINAISEGNVGILSFTRNDGTDVPEASGQSTGSDTLAMLVVEAYVSLQRLIESPAYFVQRLPGAPYWTPNDPVVLLRGPDAAPAVLKGDNGQNSNKLQCRLATQLCDRWTYEGSAYIDASDVAPEMDFDKMPPAIALSAKGLLFEAISLNAGAPDRVVKALQVKVSTESEAQIVAHVDSLFESLNSGASDLSSGPLALSGVLPIEKLGQTWGGNTWQPLFLNWTMEYAPVEDEPPETGEWAFDTRIVLSNHTLDAQNVELQLNAGVTPSSSATITGVTPLAKGALVNLKSAIGNLTEGDPNPDAELVDIRNKLESYPLLSQTLGGFHRSLNGQFQTLQVDMAIAFTEDPSTDAAASVVGNLNDAAPISGDASSVAVDWPDLYAPLRTGVASLGSLSLIDSFGQTRAVVADSVAWATALKTADGRIVLPPRLSQASRIQFRWMRCDQEAVQANDPPVESPICGWALPDYLDDGLIIFDADGDALGSLLLIGDPQEVVWREAPIAGHPVRPKPDHEKQKEQIEKVISDAVLRAFVLGLFDNGPTYLAAVLSAIDRVLTTVLPQQSGEDAVSSLMGHPLALTRAQVDLSVKGLIGPDQSWNALLSDSIKLEGRSYDKIDTGRARTDLSVVDSLLVRENRGIGRVEFPVRLGDLEQTDDGLIGYFICTGGARDFDKFYSPGAQESSEDVVNSDTKPILLRLTDEPLVLAMLHDPRVAIHATSGILPVKKIQLASYQYVGALKKLAVYFYAGPLLMSAVGSPGQLPSVTGFNWVWRQAVDNQWRQQPWTGAANDRAQSSYSPLHLTEGWMALVPNKAP